MIQLIADYYFKLTLKRPMMIGLAVILLLSLAVWHAQQFKLDASSDSLVLENDQDLRFYRAVRARYGSDDFLIVTLQPNMDLFSKQSLGTISSLRDELAGLERVESVLTILDVPLIDSPRVSVSELQEQVRTLETEGMDIQLARREFRESPLYRSLLSSIDEKTTALLVYLKHDEVQLDLQKQRDQLWEKQMSANLTAEESGRLLEITAQIREQNTRLQAQLQTDIASVRAILEKYKDKGDIVPSFYLSRRFNAAHSRAQPNIHQDNVRLLFSSALNGFFAGSHRTTDFVTKKLFQILAQQRGNQKFVFNN
jgi:hypothetical protein